MINLEIKAETLRENLKEIEVALGEVDTKLQFKVMLVCEEILTNQIRHADFENLSPEMTLSIEILSEEKVKLIFKDNAMEFNLLNHPDPDVNAEIDDRKLGGLGIFLSKKYAKELTHSYDEGRNILRVTL